MARLALFLLFIPLFASSAQISFDVEVQQNPMPSSLYAYTFDIGLPDSNGPADSDNVALDLAGGACPAGDAWAGLGRDILNRACWMFFMVLVGWIFTHKYESIEKFIGKVLVPAAANWRRVVVLGMILLFTYLLLRLLEDAMIRALMIALIVISVCIGGAAGAALFDRAWLSLRRYFGVIQVRDVSLAA